jgi:UDP-N-acetylmuramoyl-tripeptide--D-alanyl-D-alanine ligase
MATLVQLVKPSHAIITSIGPSHLLGIGSLEQVAKEKASILSLGAKGLISTQAARFIPGDSFETYGLEQATYTASLSKDERSLTYKGLDVKLPSLGKAMAMNAVAALALAEKLGVPLTDAAKRIEAAKLEPGRLEFKKAGTLLIIDDTYNSNPLSVHQALDILRQQTPPHIAILGDMLELGGQSHHYHHELGEATKNVKTYAIGRESIAILETNPKAKHFLTVESFIGQLPSFESGTVLVKASRGMRLERVVEALLGVKS